MNGPSPWNVGNMWELNVQGIPLSNSVRVGYHHHCLYDLDPARRGFSISGKPEDCGILPLSSSSPGNKSLRIH